MGHKKYTEWESPEGREQEAQQHDDPLAFMKEIRWTIAELIVQAAQSAKK